MARGANLSMRCVSSIQKHAILREKSQMNENMYNFSSVIQDGW